MVNCKECGQCMFRTDPYRYLNPIDGEKQNNCILGYTIPFFFCSNDCRKDFETNNYIERFPEND